MRTKLIVIGLDGATLKIIEPLVKAGHLPNIQKIFENGVHGVLHSCIPPISCPSWLCYSTGKNPEKLNFYGWWTLDRTKHDIYFNDYTRVKEPEIWDYLGDNGIKCGVMNFPVHFPPRKINGLMICGMQASETQEYTYPSELKNELKEKFDYYIEPRHRLRLDPEKAFEELKELFKLRFKVAQWMLDKVDFLNFVIFRIDEVSHEKYHHKEIVKEAWQVVDEEIGKFLDLGINVLFNSDHGFGPVNKAFSINKWFEDNNYLATKNNKLGKAMKIVGLNRDRLEKFATKHDLLPLLKKVTPEFVQKSVLEIDGTTSNQRMESMIDWERTKAFVADAYGVYLFDDSIKEKLISEIASIKDLETGEHVMEWVRDAQEIYGRKTKEMPDIIYYPKEGTRVITQLGGEGQWVQQGWEGDHRDEGIIMAYGPDFRQGLRIESNIVDLPPTILFMMDVPIPKDMDGKVLTEIFKEESKCLKNQPKYQGASEERRLTSAVKSLKFKGKV